MFRPQQNSNIAVTVVRSGDAALTTLGVVGHLTAHTRDEFKSRVVEELANTAAVIERDALPMRFLFDFGPCTEVDTRGLDVLVAVAKRIRDAGGVVHASGLSGDIAELFRLTKLDQVISIEAAPAVAHG